MLRRPDPLVPPALFRRRAFTVINIATFLVYGALYTWSLLQSLFLQGVLGYTALASAAVGLPVGIFLTLGSTRVGTLAGRIGPKPFLVAGPALMGRRRCSGWRASRPIRRPGCWRSAAAPARCRRAIVWIDVLPTVDPVRHRA